MKSFVINSVSVAALVLIAALTGGCDTYKERYESCESWRDRDQKERKQALAKKDAEAAGRAAKVANRYRQVVKKVADAVDFRAKHLEMPQGTILVRFNTGGSEGLLFPAEVEELRKERMILDAMGWMFEFEEFPDQKVPDNELLNLPPPAPPPAPTKVEHAPNADAS